MSATAAGGRFRKGWKQGSALKQLTHLTWTVSVAASVWACAGAAKSAMSAAAESSENTATEEVLMVVWLELLARQKNE